MYLLNLSFRFFTIFFKIRPFRLISEIIVCENFLIFQNFYRKFFVIWLFRPIFVIFDQKAENFITFLRFSSRSLIKFFLSEKFFSLKLSKISEKVENFREIFINMSKMTNLIINSRTGENSPLEGSRKQFCDRS